MLPIVRRFLAALTLAACAVLPASAAGVIPFALTQQIDANGLPVVGCRLNIYVVGTTATLQNVYGDFGLTQTLPNPLTCDVTGRIPQFYLADGQVHVNLTDSGGVVLVDIPVMQVVGPSSGGGGGGGTVDANSVLSTGDVKFRQGSEILPGWVKLNQQTIGSATSGASGRANNDTAALFVWLWLNCTDAHCPVSTGRGASGLADFGANKTITLPDWRARQPLGRDQMDALAPAGRLLAANVTSGGGDGTDTPGASGGEANHLQLTTELVAHLHGTGTLVNSSESLHTHGIGSYVAGNESSHTHGAAGLTGSTTIEAGAPNAFGVIVGSVPVAFAAGAAGNVFLNTQYTFLTATTTIGGSTAAGSAHTHTLSGTSGAGSAHTHTISGSTANSAGGGGTMAVVDPFILGTWYIRL